MYNIKIGPRIRACRHRKFTSAELAEHVGISVEHMRALESGKETPSVETFSRIVLALNILPSALLIDDAPLSPNLSLAKLEFLSHEDVLLLNDLLQTILRRKGGMLHGCKTVGSPAQEPTDGTRTYCETAGKPYRNVL